MPTKGSILAFFVFLSLLLSGCKGEYKPPQEKPRQVKAAVLEVKTFSIPQYRVFPGEICAREQITLASKLSGYAREVLVDEGQVVRPGEVLIRLDDRDLRAEIKALKADLRSVAKEKQALSAQRAYAQANFERFKRLFQEKAATQEELDRARAAYESLKAREEALKAREEATRARLAKVKSLLAYTVIRSPARALVVKRLVSQGSLVSPGVPLLVLDDLSAGFRFCAAVDESLLGRLKRGENLRVDFPAQGQSLVAPVAAVVKRVDPSSRTFTLKLDLPQGSWPSGLFGRVYVPVGQGVRVLIPRKAVVFRGDLSGVYVLDQDNRARFRVVRLGEAFVKQGGVWAPAVSDEPKALVEVLSGLAPGERIVLEAQKVHEGDQIVL